MGIFSTLFGDETEKYLKNLQPIVKKIGDFEKAFAHCSLEDLRLKTQDFKERLSQGATLNDLLPEAFAVAREAARRTLGQRPFDVQLVGGIVLHEGKIAEMKTGEGKTLAATLPVYLNALKGKGVHVVTVNDYLAKRDAVWMGQIYHALGMSVGCITHDASFLYDPEFQQGSLQDEARDTLGSFQVQASFLRPVSRKEAYKADITYGTNNEFGFDYLRDNMVFDLDFQVQRSHHYAIVDEIDSILIDEARTPLIISAPDVESSSWYKEFARLIPRLNAKTDFEVDEKLRAVTLTESGVNKVEQLMEVKDIYQERGIKFLHHLEQALRAEVLFQRDRDYVVKGNQVIIVDEFTGRLLPGRRFSGGLHQALEAKEGVVVQPESLTLASISFQNYFRMYEKLAGMTGTALTSEEEFHKTYNLQVIPVPTNKLMIREDLPDRVYQTKEAKFKALVKEIKERYEKGQPLLVGTVSIEKNEYLAKLLEREGIPHEILNAKHHEREGAIIAQAGRKGALTLATNMAGRGVDIVLGGNPFNEKEAKEVRALGGLHVICTERHEARRIDNQLRGRSGRQGDPGSSQFFVSLEDDLIRIFGGERIQKLMEQLRVPKEESIESKLVSNAIESAQSKIEGFNFDARKHLLEYDDVLNKHRETIYRKRREILERAKAGTLRETVLDMAEKHGKKKEEYEKKEQELGAENMRQAEKLISLRVLDSLWLEHLENMEALRDSVRLRAYGQQDPLVEYKNEGHKMFRNLVDNMDALMVNMLFQISSIRREPTQQGVGLPAEAPRSGAKVGRNDPCPCGSGRKWKRCGLINAPEHKA